MSILFSTRTERMLIATMLEYPHLLSYGLPKLEPQQFGNEAVREIFERMIALTTNGKTLPSARVMGQDPGLSKAASNILLMEARERHQIAGSCKADIDAAIDILEHYRHIRIIYESTKRTTEELEDPKVSIEKIQTRIQDDLTQ